MLEVVCWLDAQADGKASRFIKLFERTRTMKCISVLTGEQSRLISFWSIVPYDDPEIMA